MRSVSCLSDVQAAAPCGPVRCHRAPDAKSAVSIELFGKAIARKPDFVGPTTIAVPWPHWAASTKHYPTTIRLLRETGPRGAYHNRGAALAALGQFATALASYDNALVLKPGRPKTHTSRGAALASLGRPDAALSSCDTAIAETGLRRITSGNALRDLPASGDQRTHYRAMTGRRAEPEFRGSLPGRGAAR